MGLLKFLLQTMYGHSHFLKGVSLCFTRKLGSSHACIFCLTSWIAPSKEKASHSIHNLSYHYHLFILHCTIFVIGIHWILNQEYRQDTDLARPNPGPKSQSQTVPKAEQSLNKYLSNESFLWNFIAPHFRSWYFRSRISRTKNSIPDTIKQIVSLG